MKRCNFFILKRNHETHDLYTEKVFGYEQDFDVDGKTITICFRLDGNYWSTTEKSTGLPIGSWFDTRKDAVKDIKEKLPIIKEQISHGLNYGYMKVIEKAYRDEE